MDTQFQRTTIDIHPALAQQLKGFALRQKLTQKQVITQALVKYLEADLPQIDTNSAWSEIRRLSLKGSQSVNLQQALRADRDRL